MDLKPITYKLAVKTTVPSGSIRYSRRDIASQPGADSGNYCVLVLNPSGETMITDLRRGQYDIDVRADSPEYENKRVSISVPQDVSDPNSTDEVRSINVELANKKSIDTFSANAWSDADWIKPTAWKIDKGLKVRNTEGIALPSNERYRYYLDFELIANVKLNDDGNVGFVLHAKNTRDHYLLLICGPKSAEGANTARLYIVKNDARQYVSSLPISSFTSAIASDKGFQTRIQGDKTGFTLLIEDTDGVFHKAGQLKDDLNTYPIGAIGVGALEKPDFDIRQFQVCTPRCQQ
jgi:hypothetical protein